jgi:hypothetical protein
VLKGGRALEEPQDQKEIGLKPSRRHLLQFSHVPQIRGREALGFNVPSAVSRRYPALANAYLHKVQARETRCSERRAQLLELPPQVSGKAPGCPDCNAASSISLGRAGAILVLREIWSDESRQVRIASQAYASHSRLGTHRTRLPSKRQTLLPEGKRDSKHRRRRPPDVIYLVVRVT